METTQFQEDLKTIGISGNDGADTLARDAGNDVLYSGNGNDAISGNSGNDVLHGEGGINTLTGGPGNDKFYCKPLGIR